MSLLRQLLFTLLYYQCNADEIDITLDNINDQCARLTIQYEDHTLTVDRQDYLLYDRSVWSSIDSTTFLSYDGLTDFWELQLPSTSQLSNLYRVQSDNDAFSLIPPSTVWTNKWTQNQLHLKFECNPALPPSSPPS